MNNTINNKKKREFVDSVNNSNNINNRTLIIGFSKCGKIYLMNHFLFQKQEPILITTKSINQYPKIKAQTSDVQLFLTICCYQTKSNFDLFFARGRHNNIDIYYISQSYFRLSKNTYRINSTISILFKQTLRDIVLIFNDIAGLDMNLE